MAWLDIRKDLENLQYELVAPSSLSRIQP
jgi:hypothetical protein